MARYRAYRMNIQTPLAFAGVILIAILLMACGPREPETATLPEIKVGPDDVAVETLQLLQLQPASSDFAVAAPSFGFLHDNVVELARRMHPDPDEFALQYQRMVREQQRQYGLSQAEDLRDVLTGTGIDPDRAMALFVELEELEPVAAGGHDSDAPWSAFGAALLESAPAVMVLPLSDKDNGDALASRILSNMAQRPVEELTEVTYRNVTLIQADASEDGGYFVVDDWLVVGRPLGMVRETADRLVAPAPIRYGTQECPVEHPHETVLLAQPQQMAKMIDMMLAYNVVTDMTLRSVLALQTQPMRELTDDDPVVLTLRLEPDTLAMASRIDTERHTELAQPPETLGPLHYATLLPPEAHAAFAFRLTPETKEQMQGDWLDGIHESMQEDAGVQQGIGMFRMVAGMMGDEIALAVRGQHNGIPLATAILGLDNPQMTRNLLQALLGLPTDPAETYRGVPIMDLALPLPGDTGIYFAFAGEQLILSTDLPGLRTVIDRLQGEEGTVILETVEPPLDPETPRNGFVVLRHTLLSDVVMPVMGLTMGEDAFEPDVAGGLRTISQTFREAHLSSGMENAWLTTRLALVLAEEPVAEGQ